MALLVTAVLVVTCGRGGIVGSQPSHPVVVTPLDAGVVRTTTGLVRGLVASDYRLFQGIPYAAPPVGPLRWQPPQPPAPWPGVRDASKPGPRCIQASEAGPGAGTSTGEDCLILNVWTPAAVRITGKRPVMVWIHGGSFVNGAGDIYGARRLAARGDIVVVTINYRLDALGFLAHPSLGGEGGEGGAYGLADQQAALRWVRGNIANFGGDPTKVAIAGESAGGMSVCDHLVAPGSAGLFRAAIIQSGSCQAQADIVTAQRLSVGYAASVGCTDPATAARCLRRLPATALARPLWYSHIGTDSLSGPATGTEVLPVDPLAAFATGGAARVPVLIGTNHDEFTLFTALRYLHSGRGMTATEFPGVLADVFGVDGRAVQARYPPERHGGNVSLAFSAAVTDAVFACVADRMADALSHGAPVYAYEFDDRDAPAPEPFRHVPFPLGASHSLELRYLFDVSGAPPLDAQQRKLSEQMIDDWSHFVITGAPAAAGQPAWPPVSADSALSPVMSLRTDGSKVVTSFAESHQCRFWATLKQ